MHKTEPKIVAPGYTDEEIYEWMTKKLAAINQLREVLSYRQETIDSLKKTGSGNHGFITGCYFRYCADKLGSHSFSSKSSK
ncbi:Prophage protein [Escherichia coli]